MAAACLTTPASSRGISRPIGIASHSAPVGCDMPQRRLRPSVERARVATWRQVATDAADRAHGRSRRWLRLRVALTLLGARWKRHVLVLARHVARAANDSAMSVRRVKEVRAERRHLGQVALHDGSAVVLGGRNSSNLKARARRWARVEPRAKVRCHRGALREWRPESAQPGVSGEDAIQNANAPPKSRRGRRRSRRASCTL